MDCRKKERQGRYVPKLYKGHDFLSYSRVRNFQFARIKPPSVNNYIFKKFLYKKFVSWLGKAVCQDRTVLNFFYLRIVHKAKLQFYQCNYSVW
jgi:hypothetical protein